MACMCEVIVARISAGEDEMVCFSEMMARFREPLVGIGPRRGPWDSDACGCRL